MRISHIQIENFRSHLSTRLDFDEYTALIGANGAGKSSVFYALEWFFEGGPVLDGVANSTALAAGDPVTVSVGVAFVDLTEADRERLGEYGRGDSAHFARSWTTGDDKSKVVGNALAGPGFAEVRGAPKSPIAGKRTLYAALKERVSGLADLGGSPSISAIDQALADWESIPEHAPLLERVDHSDANHLFGINGRNVIRECFRLILVPAATDITANVGAAGKGSILAELIGEVTNAASAKARTAWLTKYSKEISELNDSIRTGVEAATDIHAERINSRLKAMIPSASVEFATQVPEWTPKGDPSISTQVTLGSATGDLSSQGHGTQRAIMIAMFQTMAPDATSAEAETIRIDEEDEAAYDARLDDIVKRLPTLMVCIEEPEIYQHPIRARAFAKVLADLAEQPSVQIAVATHSPYFVRPSQFGSLRRLSLVDGNSAVSSTTLQSAATVAEMPPEKYKMTVERYFPSVFSEGFFADAVVLVEGDTDKVCLEGVADGLGFSFDVAGIAVIHVGGKNELRMSHQILSALKVPTYIIVDGDADRADEKYQAGTQKHANATKSNMDQTTEISDWLPTGKPVTGAVPYSFGDPTLVTDAFAIWRDDIESELAKWPSFVAELSNAGGALRQKKASTYRAAAIGANKADVPGNLKHLVESIRVFAG